MPRATRQLGDEELVRDFAAAAAQLAEAVNNWETGALEAHRLWRIEKLLRARGQDSRLRLAPLLDERNRFIQYYAALALEALIPSRCRQIIEENSRKGDAIAGDAGMDLDAVDSGFSKPV